MSAEFMNACNRLIENHQQFTDGQITPLEHGRNREKHLGDALRELALSMGVILRWPLHIDSRGDFMLTAESENAGHRGQTGHFGEFAEAINPHGPRCGMLPTAVLMPEAGWCYLNHFSAERMVLQHHALQAQRLFDGDAEPRQASNYPRG